MTRRRWTFRAPALASCWLRADMAEVVVHDRQTAFLLYLIYRGARVPFTVHTTREEALA